MGYLIYPSSDIAVIGFTPTPASPATLYDKVDDPAGAPDDASTYIGTTGAIDLAHFGPGSIAYGGNPGRVKIVVRAKGTAGTNSLTAMIYYVSVGGGPAKTWANIPTSWATYEEEIYIRLTGNPWTEADINAIDRLALTLCNSVQVSQFYLEVLDRVPSEGLRLPFTPFRGPGLC